MPTPRCMRDFRRPEDGQAAGKACCLTVSEQLLKEQGKEFFAIWQEAVTSYLPQTPLTKEEGEQLLAFGEHLGYLDREMQERTLSLYLEELEREMEELNQEIAQKGRLYTSAGILTGLFLAVIFI